MSDARAIFPPSNHLIRSGRTGAIIPNARKSSVTVIKINANAAFVVPPRCAVPPAGAGNCPLSPPIFSMFAIILKFQPYLLRPQPAFSSFSSASFFAFARYTDRSGQIAATTSTLLNSPAQAPPCLTPPKSPAESAASSTYAY